jgi:hypothetical protein
MSHPYNAAPQTAFWSKAVSTNFDQDTLILTTSLIKSGERVSSAGSCFAANIVPYLESAGIEYVRRGGLPQSFDCNGKDNFSYSKFSAGYGNIYTVRAMTQLINRALGRFQPVEDRWHIAETVIDPFRPGLRWPATSDREFDILTRQYLSEVLDVILASDVFVFTLGLTEAWLSKVDGAVFPACPGTVAGTYDPGRHYFKNFAASEVISDLHQLVRLLASLNSSIRVILTVSPVPLVATATTNHVLVATTYSKSVLRVAAGEIADCYESVCYFPAYEIITGPQAPFDYFKPDRREPSEIGIRAVMNVFLNHCEVAGRPQAVALEHISGDDRSPNSMSSDYVAVPMPSNTPSMGSGEFAAALSKLVADAECEEAAAGL